MMKENIKKILREYTENQSNKGSFKKKVDYMQKKVIQNSKYPEETAEIDDMKDRIQKKVNKAYKEVTGKEPVSDDNIIVKVDDGIKPGKIGAFKHPENEKDLGVMKIHPKALDDTNYVKDIIKHELIHAAHGVEDTSARNHSGVFQKIADKVDLPKKYRH